MDKMKIETAGHTHELYCHGWASCGELDGLYFEFYDDTGRGSGGFVVSPDSLEQALKQFRDENKNEDTP